MFLNCFGVGVGLGCVGCCVSYIIEGVVIGGDCLFYVDY